VTAVDDVSFSIDEGKVFGLIGPNGAGKTTTIRMIMHIIIPDSGKIAVMGESNAHKITEMIGYLPEERGMYRKMKVIELLMFLTQLKSMPKKEARKSIDQWLERVELSDWKNKKVEELSKGMQQKIQFIGTMLHNPKLLILDEPFGGLDPINQNLVKDILLDLKSKGTTIIFSTHVMESAEKLCEEIFLVNKGKEVLNGKLSEIKKQFGRQNVYIEYDGDSRFLEEADHVLKVDNYGNAAEIQLKKEGSAQALLKKSMTMAEIHRFEIREPSLHDIFIETIGEIKEEGGDHE
jgi:ABC-2 type transport system ATP-binding protein